MDRDRFLCDSMLGGLSRWLRSAGYDAEFAGPIDDGALVERALASGAILLTSDQPLMERRPIRGGDVRAVFVPRARPLLEQTAFVLHALALGVRDARCISCGGEIARVDRREVVAEMPAASYEVFDEVWRCARCERVLWKGAHWRGIEARRAAIAQEIIALAAPSARVPT